MSQQVVSADIIPNSAVGILSPKTEGTKTKTARVLIKCLACKFRSSYFAHLATLKSNNSLKVNSLKDTAETESEVAEKSSWDQANRGGKLGLAWRNRKKISQTTFTYRSSS
jgi:hypothetical protein